MHYNKKLIGKIFVILLALSATGCAGALDKVTARLEDTSIKGVVLGKVQDGADNAPKRFVIIDGLYGDTLEKKHLLQQGKGLLTKATYAAFNSDKRYVQLMLKDAGWEEISPEQFLKDKSNVTIITMYTTSWLYQKAPALPAILTPGEKVKIIAKDVAKSAAKGVGKSLLKGALGVKDDEKKEPPKEGDPVTVYYYLVVGAFKTTDGNDTAKRPTELYWQTTSFIKRKVKLGNEEGRDNVHRFLPVLAKMMTPHLGKATEGKQKVEWPSQEIAKFKNDERFYEGYECKSSFLIPSLKTVNKDYTSKLNRAEKELEGTQSLKSKNKFLASLLAQHEANLQQDVWDYQNGIKTVSNLIEVKC